MSGVIELRSPGLLGPIALIPLLIISSSVQMKDGLPNAVHNGLREPSCVSLLQRRLLDLLDRTFNALSHQLRHTRQTRHRDERNNHKWQYRPPSQIVGSRIRPLASLRCCSKDLRCCSWDFCQAFARCHRFQEIRDRRRWQTCINGRGCDLLVKGASKFAIDDGIEHSGAESTTDCAGAEAETSSCAEVGVGCGELNKGD